MTATMPLAALFFTTSTRPAPRKLSDLKSDSQGAIMMTGLFMSCFLIGSLWFVIGIGDTIVFRDRMQEAADHGAFSSAALHAKGMNFISLCNLVLLAAVTIHIILGIVHDIALAICIVSAIFTLGLGCSFWVTMERIWSGYFKVLKPAATAIGVGEKVASYGYPAIGLIEGLQNGRSYKGKSGNEVTVLPLSTSLLPGGGKSGLPVKAQPMNYLCVKLVNVTGKLLESALGFAGGAASKAIDLVKGWIGKGIQFRYCNSLDGTNGQIGDAAAQEARNKGQQKIDEVNKEIDKQNANRKEGDTTPAKDKLKDSKSGGGGGGGGIDPGFDSFWGKDGPMTVFEKGANGSVYMQTYAINVAPTMNDSSESHVGMARGTKVGLQKYTTNERPLGYFAQAEFFFDCDSNWASDGCNNEDNATFQIKWRARLKKFSIGEKGDKVLNIALTGLANLNKLEQIKDTLGHIGGKAGDLLNGGGITGASDLKRAFDAFKPDALKSDFGDLQKAFSITPGGIYH